jgi:hypothetical protein
MQRTPFRTGYFKTRGESAAAIPQIARIIGVNQTPCSLAGCRVMVVAMALMERV